MSSILFLILILILVGVIPAWPHSRSWGYGPSGGIGLILVILLIEPPRESRRLIVVSHAALADSESC